LSGRSLVQAHRGEIESVAEALLQSGWLSGREVRANFGEVPRCVSRMSGRYDAPYSDRQIPL
jgi:hypothetical protein